MQMEVTVKGNWRKELCRCLQIGTNSILHKACFLRTSHISWPL
jgi:hypothetical protein